MVEYLELGFWLLAAFALILFVQTIVTWRKYKLMRVQYEKVWLQYEKERESLEGLEGQVRARLAEKTPSAKIDELKNRLENLETAISIEHSKVEDAMGTLEEMKKMPSVGEELSGFRLEVEKASKAVRKLGALEKKVKKTSEKQIVLSRKITGLRKVSSQLKTSRARLSKVLQEHEKLRTDFEKHELIPIHSQEAVQASDATITNEEMEAVNKAIKNIDGQLKTLRRTIEDAEKKLGQHGELLKIVEEKIEEKVL